MHFTAILQKRTKKNENYSQKEIHDKNYMHSFLLTVILRTEYQRHHLAQYCLSGNWYGRFRWLVVWMRRRVFHTFPKRARITKRFCHLIYYIYGIISNANCFGGVFSGTFGLFGNRLKFYFNEFLSEIENFGYFLNIGCIYFVRICSYHCSINITYQWKELKIVEIRELNNHILDNIQIIYESYFYIILYKIIYKIRNFILKFENNIYNAIKIKVRLTNHL